MDGGTDRRMSYLFPPFSPQLSVEVTCRWRRRRRRSASLLHYIPGTMADSTDAGSNKRQRLTSYHRIMNIKCLPDDTLASVAKFLPKPSRALFAVGMTSPSLTRKKPWKLPKSVTTNQAILSLNSSTIGHGIEDEQRGDDDDGEYWTTLDFVDIDETLANKLTDDDIGGALICIDAVNRLKSLKLTGCVNIKGTGLKPLKGSKVLE